MFPQYGAIDKKNCAPNVNGQPHILDIEYKQKVRNC